MAVALILLLLIGCLFLLWQTVLWSQRSFFQGRTPPTSIILCSSHGSVLMLGPVIFAFLAHLPLLMAVCVVVCYVGYLLASFVLCVRCIREERLVVQTSSPFCKSAYCIFLGALSAGGAIFLLIVSQQNGFAMLGFIFSFPLCISLVAVFCLLLLIASLVLREKAKVSAWVLACFLLLFSAASGYLAHRMITEPKHFFSDYKSTFVSQHSNVNA